MRKPRTLGDRVLVRVKKEIVDNQYRFNRGFWEKVSDSGILLERLTQEQYENLQLGTCEAYVVQLGPQAYKGIGDGEPWVKVGQLITINKWSGVAIGETGDGEIYRLINDEDAMVEWEGEGLND